MNLYRIQVNPDVQRGLIATSSLGIGCPHRLADAGMGRGCYYFTAADDRLSYRVPFELFEAMERSGRCYHVLHWRGWWWVTAAIAAALIALALPLDGVPLALTTLFVVVVGTLTIINTSLLSFPRPPRILLALLAALCLNLRAEIVLWTTGIDAPWSIAAAIVIGGCGLATLIGVFQAMVEARG